MLDFTTKMLILYRFSAKIDATFFKGLQVFQMFDYHTITTLNLQKSFPFIRLDGTHNQLRHGQPQLGSF